MTVSGVENENVGACLKKSTRAFGNVLCNSYCRAAKKSAVLVLRGIRITVCFFDILYCNKTAELVSVVYYGELFYLVLAENFSFACSSVVPTGTVIRFSLVITSLIGTL